MDQKMPLRGLRWVEFRDHVVMVTLFSRNYQISAVQVKLSIFRGQVTRERGCVLRQTRQGTKQKSQ